MTFQVSADVINEVRMAGDALLYICITRLRSTNLQAVLETGQNPRQCALHNWHGIHRERVAPPARHYEDSEEVLLHGLKDRELRSKEGSLGGVAASFVRGNV